jgi:acyl transferase domain-containing protein
LIKTVLALERELIPPSLHFDRPNPEIDFEASPFRVAAEASEWRRRDGRPRRAGVSSFGIGGTNAHVVVEEAPAAAAAAAPRVQPPRRAARAS